MRFFFIVPALLYAICIFVLYPIGLIFDGSSEFDSMSDLLHLVFFSKIVEWLALLPWLCFLICFIFQRKIGGVRLMQSSFYLSVLLGFPFLITISEWTELAAIFFVSSVIIAPLWFFSFIRPYDRRGY